MSTDEKQREILRGRLAAWAAIAALTAWPGIVVAAIAISATVPDGMMTRWSAGLLNAMLVAGPLCALIGIWQGVLSQRKRPGRIGRNISVVCLCLMTALYATSCYYLGGADRLFWFTPETERYSGCG